MWLINTNIINVMVIFSIRIFFLSHNIYDKDSSNKYELYHICFRSLILRSKTNFVYEACTALLVSSYLLLLLLFSSPPLSVGPNFYGSSCRKVYIKSPKTRLIDQRLYDYCRATHTHVQNSGGTPWFTTFIIYMCPTSWNSTDDFGFAVYVHSDVIFIYIYIKYVTLYIILPSSSSSLPRKLFVIENTKRRNNKYERRAVSGPRYATVVVKRQEDEIASGSARFSEMPYGESDGMRK